MLDLALAKRPATVHAYSPPPCFSGERVFYLPTGDLNLIKPAAKSLLEEFGGYLASRQLATRLFHCELIRNLEPVARIAVGFRRPAYRAAAMMLLLEEHLSGTRIDAEVTSIAIAGADLEPLAARQVDLFQTTTADDRAWTGLIEQLEARLGTKALKRLLIYPDHRPEHASLLTESRFPQQMPNGSGRPLWLLEQPEPLGVRQKTRLARPAGSTDPLPAHQAGLVGRLRDQPGLLYGGKFRGQQAMDLSRWPV